MRQIGLHLRLDDSILDAARYAIRLGMPIFQCFLINQTKKKCIVVDKDVLTDLQNLQSPLPKIYIHGSYWINLAGLCKRGYTELAKEVHIAKQLGCTDIILHPGSVRGITGQKQKVNALARIINDVTKNESGIHLMLENTSHGNRSVGSNLEDFYYLKQKLDHPERISFCIDTAHAHSYGYNLVDEKKRNDFIELIDQTMGIDKVELIHLNDAIYAQGSRIDKHAPIGKGYIGEEALKAFALDPRLVSIPLILELPILPADQEDAMLQKVKRWHL